MANKKRGRPPKIKKAQIEVAVIEDEKIFAKDFVDTIQDRMLRYGKPRMCPKCGAMPVVTMMKRNEYRLFRCRECSHRWEVTE